MLLAFVCALTAYACRGGRWLRDSLVVAAAVLGITGALVSVPLKEEPGDATVKPGPSGKSNLDSTASTPQFNHEAGFVSSQVCQECHPKQYASWHATYHRTMTQTATPESVIPSFENVTLESRGRRYHLERRGDEFWADMNDPATELRAFLAKVDLADRDDVPRKKMKIVMTTGSHHHQTYWTQNRNGTLIQFPWVYHIRQKRWVFRIDSFLRPPRDDFSYNVWNMHCLGCHSTGGEPRMDSATKTMHSVAELGIACEACHGPGAYHVAGRRAEKRGRTGDVKAVIDFDVVNPRLQAPDVSAQICGQCHSTQERKDEAAWLAHGDPYRAGHNNFHANRFIPEVTDDPQGLVTVPSGAQQVQTRFWPDGTIRTGGREYNGLLRSACYLDGEGDRKMMCIPCHSMHDSDPNKLVARGMETNRACTQCHDESQYTTDLQEHTHHPPDSAGSRCYNCHMPNTSYALFTAIRSHRIRKPRARGCSAERV